MALDLRVEACSVTWRSAPGAAGASCASASRSPTSASRRCFARATASARVMTADAYGAGEADELLGPRAGRRAARGLRARRRGRPRLLRGRARRRQGLPALHRPAPARPRRLRRLPAHGGRAQPRALRRRRASTCCCCTTPTAAASSRPRSGRRCARCATRAWRASSASRPGPANGFTLDVIGCFERYGELIDWAMLILNPFEPWPGELALAAAARHGVQRDHPRGGLRRPLPRRRATRARVRPTAITAASARTAGSRPAARSSSACARSPSATG